MSGTGLVRQLGVFDSTMIMAGIVIGSGIFLTTGVMAQSIPSTGLILLAWLVGGLITLAGALTYAELGAALPEAGGPYVYLREAYGSLPAFLFGWQLFLVYMTGGIAGLAVAFGEYCGYFFSVLSTENVLASGSFSLLGVTWHPSLTAAQLVGVAAILVLSVLNYWGLALGKMIQNLLTVVKIGALVLFVAVGLVVADLGSLEIRLLPAEPGSGSLVMGFGVALVAVFWAFDGWNNINLVAGEVRDPQRSLPRALIVGSLVITALYLAVNVVYLAALPLGEIIGVVRIAERASTALFGGMAAAVVSAAVIVSTFGALNGSILAGPRVYYAMARDGLFFRKLAVVHPRFRTPGFAIWLQAIWASALTLSGTFDQLITFTMFVSIGFWIAATSAVFTLRRKRPDLPRPYRAWGYPVVPALFILASAGVLLNTLIERPFEALAGIGLTGLGIPVYRLWRRRTT